MANRLKLFLVKYKSEVIVGILVYLLLVFRDIFSLIS